VTFENFVFMKADGIEIVKLIDLYIEWISIYGNKGDKNERQKSDEEKTKAKKEVVKFT
jgi:hypothetical protein